jgi:hypothetical protein
MPLPVKPQTTPQRDGRTPERAEPLCDVEPPSGVARGRRVPYPLRPMEQRPQIPPALRPYAETARALGARLTREALGPGRSSSRLDDMARRLQRELDRMIQQKFDSVPGDGEVACSAGCDHCCRTLPVMVSPVEVFALIHRVHDTHGADRALRERLVGPAAAETGGAASPAGPLPPGPLPPGPLPPCPLLGAEGLCIVYSSRPLACRGCVSADAQACAACDEDRLVPRSTVHQLGAAAMVKGVCDALDGLGLASAPVELRAALCLASRDGEAERRWFRGEDVFATPASWEADRER